jgi:PAS domain S-box-containing protein
MTSWRLEKFLMPKKDALETLRTEAGSPYLVSSHDRKSAPSCPPIHRSDGCILLGTDVRGVVGRVNPFGAAFFGKQENDIIGNTFARLALPNDADCDRRKRRFINHFLYTPEKNDSAEFETRHASGCPRRVAWTRSAVRDSGGAVVEMLYLGIEVDGTKDGRGETSPANTTPVCGPDSDYTFLEKHIENSKVWAWEMTGDDLFCYASPGVKRQLGFAPEELTGLGIDFLFPNGSKNRFRDAVRTARKGGGRKFVFESQVQCKNGGLLWIEFAGVLLFDEKNNYRGARGLGWDISEGVAAKEELVLKEQEFRYLYDNTQVVLVLLNEDGVIMNINQAGANMHGREPAEMIGRKLFEFLPESERGAATDAFSVIYRRAKAQKETFIDIEPHLIRLDSQRRPSRYLRLVPKAIRVMENERMVGILNTALDVTENHILHKELERHQFQLKKMVAKRSEEIQALQEEMLRNERLATLGRLTSTVSHEIRNPLGTINSSLYIVSERVKGKEFGVERAIARGFRAVRRCDGIIEEMLDFTRTKGFEKRTIDLSAWLDRLLSAAHLPENMSMEKRIDDGLSAPVDAYRMSRCVTNVIENSVAALQGVEGGMISVSAGMSGGRIEIRIADNGPGIPKQIQKSVFDPLYSTKQDGIGMGLPVCKQVMELHGGSIRLRSDTDRGTIVILRLPSIA